MNKFINKNFSEKIWKISVMNYDAKKKLSQKRMSRIENFKRSFLVINISIKFVMSSL